MGMATVTPIFVPRSNLRRGAARQRPCSHSSWSLVMLVVQQAVPRPAKAAVLSRASNRTGSIFVRRGPKPGKKGVVFKVSSHSTQQKWQRKQQWNARRYDG
jgi:hypothetical protein